MENVYLNKDIPEEELIRLQVFAYPHELSRLILGNLKDKRVLDVGAGPSLMLGQHVRKIGGIYIPLDVNPQFLELHKPDATELIEGNICENDILQKISKANIDIIHMRFVLMHLSEHKRRKVIKSLIEAAKGKAIFLEYNWQDLKGTTAVNNFRCFISSYSEVFGIDIYYGAKLKDEVLAATSKKADVSVFKRGNGLYYHELIPLVKATKAFLKKIQASKEALDEFDDIVSAIEFEANLSIPQGFIPPSVVCARVYN